MACLDIVGEKIAWLKSVQGFDGIEGLRKDSYCHHTVLDDDVCLIHDARSDPRVFDSVLVDSWVSYAGVPLHFEDQRIGVLCIGDSKPRDFTEEHLEALKDLAALAEREIQIAALSETQVSLAMANEELEMKARIDVLTHVWNRGAILEVAETEHAQVVGEANLALLMIDIDHFKKINDTYGHPAGDQVLRIFAERLRGATRPSDAVGRYGGEEFLVVLPGIEAHDVAQTSERIRSAISSTPIQFETHLLDVTCSIGCAIQNTSQQDDVSSLIARADAALYRAKSSGRNRAELAMA